MRQKGGRVLLIGLDAADAELIERWAAAGELETFARLMREGSWSRLRTTAEVLHVSAWPTIYTGATPGRHGLYHAYQVRAGDQRIHRADPRWMALPPFWKTLDEAGRRCIVFDAFMDAPTEGFGGVQIGEWGTWTWFGDPFSKPAGLRDRLVREIGPYPAPEHSQQVTIPDQRWFRDRLVAGAAAKARAVDWLLREQPWDMAFVTFGEPHGGGHYLWHSQDPDYPIHRPIAGLPHPLLDVYAAVDRAIGDILARHLDDRTTVLVVSGDGMGPNFSGAHLVPELLHAMDLYHAPGVGKPRHDTAAAAPKPSLTKRLREAIPMPVRMAMSRCLPRSIKYRLSLKWLNADIDWARTKAFPIHNNNEGFIRLNLAGREPRGIVEPGAAYEELLGRLERELDALRNPENGRKAGRVYAIDTVFPGSERPHLPDLVISWDESARVLDRLEGPSSGVICGKCGYETPAHYSGNHRPNAFLLAAGASVAAGSAIEGGHILDVPATMLALLGVDPPAYYEGRERSGALAKVSLTDPV
ncbi:MAG: alkaline phosphatase family protein [Geminicoccaceae bacterium]|nr:alkaline phosphatase family protein [Geminicoccaceae bacterium]MDW8369075.1 alkaline phosphatase family protein [Geminicoccaceae bacterium]